MTEKKSGRRLAKSLTIGLAGLLVDYLADNQINFKETIQSLGTGYGILNGAAAAMIMAGSIGSLYSGLEYLIVRD